MRKRFRNPATFATVRRFLLMHALKVCDTCDGSKPICRKCRKCRRDVPQRLLIPMGEQQGINFDHLLPTQLHLADMPCLDKLQNGLL